MARKPKKGKSLAEVNPELAKQWHPSKNGDLTACDVSYGSRQNVWWICDKNHVWEAPVRRRIVSGCSYCDGKKTTYERSLSKLFPKLEAEWNYSRNKKIDPKSTAPKSNKKVWWKCKKEHEWEAVIASRTEGRNCPYCSGKYASKENNLASKYPELVKEWDYEKNIINPENLTPHSSKYAFWICKKNQKHKWKAKIFMRTSSKTGCPFCTATRVNKVNCFPVTHPEIAKQWHPTKNVGISPNDFSAGSSREKVWWKCSKGHSWKGSVKSRTYIKNNKLPGCPICSNQIITNENCLPKTHPLLFSQWHSVKNKSFDPYKISAGSHYKVWWKCDKGEDHEWKTSPGSRSGYNTGCPFCTLTPQSKQELTITFELIQFFKDINPKGFKTRVKGKLWSIDIYIPQLKLGIEFDGSYWHKDKRALDKLKTENLEEEGFEIFRVREEPLKRIFDDDIISKKPFNAKKVTNDILTQIMSRYTLDANKVRKIQSYIVKKELQNEKGLEKYIEMILTEKAEKKK